MACRAVARAAGEGGLGAGWWVRRYVARLWHGAAIILVVLATFLLSASCGSPAGTTPLPIDLLRELPRARVQAPAGAPGARPDFAPSETGPVPALVMTAPSRVTWRVRMADRADLTVRVAQIDPAATTSGVTLRVGISDSRRYDELLRLSLAGTGSDPARRWQSVRVDLSPYSGRQWSLFYHPARRDWNLIINADATPGGTVALDSPTVRSRSSPHF